MNINQIAVLFQVVARQWGGIKQHENKNNIFRQHS